MVKLMSMERLDNDNIVFNYEVSNQLDYKTLTQDLKLTKNDLSGLWKTEVDFSDLEKLFSADESVKKLAGYFKRIADELENYDFSNIDKFLEESGIK